jgi:hypothetical protein
MMTHINELFMVLVGVAGIVTYQLSPTSFWRQPKGMALLGIFIFGSLGGCEYSEKAEEDKLHFAENEEKLTGSKEGYCIYLEEYGEKAIYFRQAKMKCPQAAIDEWQTIDRYQVKDGLVKDTETGLMWMRCSLGQTWDGSTCTGEAKEYNWADAMKQENTSHEGYSDWRVPTIQQLKSLVYCSSGQPKTWHSDVDPEDDGCRGDYVKPTIKTDAFPNTPARWAWSSSPVASNSNGAWIVSFYFGYGSSEYRNVSYFVRLVRGGQ